MYRRRMITTYKDHLEVIKYHIKRARQEMQKEPDRWQADVTILYLMESELIRLIRQAATENDYE